MSNLKMERLRILNRVNEAIGRDDLDSANRQMDALLNNIRPALDDGTEETLDTFLKNLQSEYRKGMSAVNSQTEHLKPLDRNEARRRKYDVMERYRTAELYAFLMELLVEERLVPMGEEGR